jgi:hypothetical protein
MHHEDRADIRQGADRPAPAQSCCRLASLLVALMNLGAVAAVRASDPRSEIEIVGDTLVDSPNHFRWTITNHNRGAIVSFRAPRYLAEDAIPPPGWTGEIIKNATTGDNEVLFETKRPAAGIYPGQSLSFEVHDRRIARTGRTKAPRPVVVGLADGSVLTISDVWCPAEESAFGKNLPLIGLGAMFAVFLLVQAARKRRRQARTSSSPD